MKLRLSSGPHIHANEDTRSIMMHVLIALVPTTAVGIYIFGVRAAWVLAVSVISCVLSEFVWQKCAKQPVRVGDLSAIVTGLILGLNLPSSVPLWLPAIGGVFAIIIGKQIFGGIGHNFMNPAILARAVLLASWPARMTTYFLPTRLLGTSAAKLGDAVTSATPLSSAGTAQMDLFLGNIGGCIGEVCKVAILLGFAYLLVMKVVEWHTPVLFVGTVFVMTFLLNIGSGDVMSVLNTSLSAILSGGLIFGAVFMATDYTTTPMLRRGQCIFALGAGIIVTLIRKFGNYPEGMTYAILLMNCATPLIDKFSHRRIYGEVKKNG